MRLRSDPMQAGFSLISGLLTLCAIGLLSLFALRAVPSLMEYWAVSKAVLAARAVARNPAEVRSSFDKLANVGYIDAISGKDLDIRGTGQEMEVNFSYQKRLFSVGPATLLIEYKGSSATASSDKPETKVR